MKNYIAPFRVKRQVDNRGVTVSFKSKSINKQKTQNQTCPTGIVDIHGKCLEKIKGIPTTLLPLAAEARKYTDPKEFADSFVIDIMHGRYWHITRDPNFKIKKQQPTDYSTMAGGIPSSVGLMVSADPELWHEYFEKRDFIAEIDLAHAIPNEDFIVVNRGFGHEIFVNNLKAVSVKNVMPIEQGLADSQKYNKELERVLNSEEDAIDFWRKANA
ncbi:Uncharacterised protein [uncultured archaeon]|nr:Uncharacterised protein [uncultured archaeon]